MPCRITIVAVKIQFIGVNGQLVVVACFEFPNMDEDFDIVGPAWTSNGRHWTQLGPCWVQAMLDKIQFVPLMLLN
jgi:hypothetical protein